MSHETAAASLEEISNWIRGAAGATPTRRGDSLGAAVVSNHTTRVQACIARARQKTFVPLVKPFRRLFRNQGAVNNSLIDAVYHLSAQNQEMQDELRDLRAVVRDLRAQLRQTPTPAAGELGNAAAPAASETGRSCG